MKCSSLLDQRGGDALYGTSFQYNINQWRKNLFAKIFFTFNFRNATPTHDVPYPLLTNMATEITHAYKDRAICK